MASIHASESEMNGNHKKRLSSPTPSNAVSSPAVKKIKLDDDIPLEANPNTIEAVKGKNKALELDMIEKNRRITYLTHKCEALLRHGTMTDTSFRCMRRQWLQLIDDLETLMSSFTEISSSSDVELGDVLNAVDSFAEVRIRAKDIKLNLPEWFLSISKGDDDVELPASAEIDGENPNQFVAPEALTELEKGVRDELLANSGKIKGLMQKLLAAIANAAKDDSKVLEYKQMLEAKRVTIAEAMCLRDQLATLKKKVVELERDVEYKEVERHRACRDYDRLRKLVECNADVNDVSVKDEQTNGSSEKERNDDVNGDKDAKAPPPRKEEEIQQEKETAKIMATLRENMSILSTKLYQERSKTDGLKRELERFRALEAAWKKDEAKRKHEHEDKLDQLREEKNHISEEFNKIRHKAKDIEQHVNEKWKKKISRIQADMAKVKSQMDEVNMKNVSLREKISNASTFRDQLTELKSVHESLKHENETLKAQLERKRNLADRKEEIAVNKMVEELSAKLSSLQKAKTELSESYTALKQSAEKSGGETVSDALKRLSELETKYESEVQAHGDTKSTIENLRLEIEEMKATETASREENDALIAEIESISKEMESMRHAKKKLIQQLDDKRNSCKKLHSQLAREEQAKAHCFEELAAVRLQVSSLGTVHKQQKAFVESIKESLHAKEKELEQLKEFVKNLQSEQEAQDSEKRKVLREAEVAKQIYTTSAAETSQKQQQLLQEKKKPCEKCESYRKKEERYEKLLQAAKSANATGELTDLERFELKDLQKLVNCSVCQDRRKNVIISKCFHMFCKECIDTNLKSRNRKCPTCKKMFGQDDVKNVWFT